MNRLINELPQATEIDINDHVIINQDGVLKKIPHYKIGHNINCQYVYSSGIECFRITAPNDNGVLETTAFMIPSGSIKSATVDGPYDYTGSPIIPNITSVSVGDSILITDPDIISANFQIENLDNTNANTLASVKIVPKSGSSYTGSAIANFVINKINMSGVSGHDGSGNTDTGASISVTGVPSRSIIYYKKSTKTTWSTTNPLIKTAGTTTIDWKVTNSNYNDYTGSNTVTITQAEITGGVWNSSKDNVNLSYNSTEGNWHGTTSYYKRNYYIYKDKTQTQWRWKCTYETTALGQLKTAYVDTSKFSETKFTATFTDDGNKKVTYNWSKS